MRGAFVGVFDYNPEMSILADVALTLRRAAGRNICQALSSKTSSAHPPSKGTRFEVRLDQYGKRACPAVHPHAEMVIRVQNNNAESIEWAKPPTAKATVRRRQRQRDVLCAPGMNSIAQGSSQNLVERACLQCHHPAGE
jgi:hypothetical protein